MAATLTTATSGLVITGSSLGGQIYVPFASSIYAAGPVVRVAVPSGVQHDFQPDDFGQNGVEDAVGALVVALGSAAIGAATASRNPDFAYAPDGRIRQSSTTLFDYKTIGGLDPLMDVVGTGTTSISNNIRSLACQTGQYMVAQAKHVTPYFSGKTCLIEITHDGFNLVAGNVERLGYYSDGTVAPYETAFDGIWIENNGGQISFNCKNGLTGVTTLAKNIEDWTGYANIADYDFTKFTVFAIDFLWLGGAVCRLWIKHGESFVLAHRFDYAGTQSGTFIGNPNQTVRYEIRNNSGGTLTYKPICAQTATEGSISESGFGGAINLSAPLNTNSVGTIYALKGIRKKTGRNYNPIRIVDAGIVQTSINDAGIMMLILNPTLSAPLTWADIANSSAQEGTATNQTITAGTGRVIFSIAAGTASVNALLISNYLTWLGAKVDGTRDELILAYMPQTSNQAVSGTLNFLEY